MRYQFTCVLAFIATACLAMAEQSDAAKKDLDALQGEWKLVTASADGQTMPEQMRQKMKRVCKGNETTTTMSGKIYIKANFDLDPSKKPKTIDYHMTGGFTTGQTQLGIYEIKDDTFKACFTKPGSPRPADFTPGEGRTISVWKRDKATRQ